MSVEYAVSREVLKRLWDEYFDSKGDTLDFTNWILRERIPYAEGIGERRFVQYPGVAITFKEEKDLTLFLLSL